jgi:GTPase SAR1 family protein
MKSEISIVSSILADGLPLLTKHVGKGVAQELANFVAERAADATPTVMVFGIYNAGKSTLLNALIGEERATASDRPETSVVTPYEWNGFKLLDTPGIDAPAEHERVSREQLSGSDIVLFILSTNGSFDEKAIYDEILDIVVSGKPVMVIVNNKDGYTQANADYRAIHDKILANLDAAGQAHNISELSQRVPVRLVNAKLALKGRLASNDTLIAASGVLPLAREIETLLQQSGAHEVAVTLRQRIVKLIDIGLAKLNHAESSSDALLIAEQQAAMQGEKDRVAAAVNGAVHRATAGFHTDFYAAVKSRNESAMQSAMQTAVAATTLAMEREIKTAGAFLSMIGTNLDDIQPIRVATKPTAGKFGTDSSQGTEEENDVSILDGVKNIASQIGKENAQQATQRATKAALELTKEWIPSLMKGTGKKTIEKMSENAGRFAGKAAPFIGPAIDTIRGIYDYYQAVKKQEEHSQTLRRQAQALADHVDQTTANLEAELLSACRVVLTSLFLPTENALAAQSRCLAREARSFVADRHDMELLKLRLANAS